MKKLNILLLGGTKDANNIIRHLKENYNTYILTTTTTEYGAKLAIESGSDDTIAKPLLKDEIINLINESDFDLMIDATHPFASHITRTCIDVSKICNIEYIRFERPALNLENIDTSRIHYTDSFEMAGKLIADKFHKGNVLHFAGSNTMEDILKSVSVDRFYPRILKVTKSIEKCEKLGIAKNHIIPMKGAAGLEENINLIEKYDACVMITKESGETGGVYEKIDAANKKNIAVVMIKRPAIEELNKKNIVSDLDELDNKINAKTGI